jgi:hypothetical protein
VQTPQNEVEANGGGLRDTEAVLREPHRREPAPEARASSDAAVGGGGRAVRPSVPASRRSCGQHAVAEHLPVLRQAGHRGERRRDKQQELQLLRSS